MLHPTPRAVSGELGSNLAQFDCPDAYRVMLGHEFAWTSIEKARIIEKSDEAKLEFASRGALTSTIPLDTVLVRINR
jgi:hypothetical protein